jgi:hypothetical protein
MGATLSSRVRHLKKRQFLASFEVLGNISAACRTAGIDRETYRYWMEHDEQFSFAVNVASQVATEHLEEEAYRRAVVGVATETPVYYKGDELGTVVRTEYSDTLLIFLLKARAPHKYRDRATGQSDEPDRVKVYADLDLDQI